MMLVQEIRILTAHFLRNSLVNDGSQELRLLFRTASSLGKM
jgi:hypothetical protein